MADNEQTESVRRGPALADVESLDIGDQVGNAFRLFRRVNGWSQRRLANVLGWNKSKVARWEMGRLAVAIDEVDGVLRAMGFRLIVVPGPELRSQLERSEVDIVDHVRDRGGNRFPAHCVVVPERAMATWNWTRHQGEPNPLGGGLAFRRRLASDADPR